MLSRVRVNVRKTLEVLNKTYNIGFEFKHCVGTI